MVIQTNKKSRELDIEVSSDYYFIQVRSKTEITGFRFHNVGVPGHVLWIEGLHSNGTSCNVGWLISKQDAHIENHFLEADSKHAQEVLAIHGPAYHIEGDVFI